MPWHRVNFFDYGETVLGVGAERVGQGDCVDLVDSAWPTLDFSSGHVDHNNRHIVWIENSYGTSSARVDAHDFHGLDSRPLELSAQVTTWPQLLTVAKSNWLTAPLGFWKWLPSFIRYSLGHYFFSYTL